MKTYRKVLIGLLLLCLLLPLVPAASVAQTSRVISLQYSYSTPAVTAVDGVSAVSMPGLNNMTFIEAELPVQSLQIMLPYGTTVDTCNVTYSKERVVTDVILPEPGEFVALSDNSVTMRASDVSANSHYSEGTVQYVRGFALYAINLYPVTYQDNTLRYVDEISLSISLTSSVSNEESDEMDYIPTIVDTEFLPEAYECPENLSSYFRITPTVTNDDSELGHLGIVDYIIITTEDLAAAFAPLIEFKESKGLICDLVTVETIYAYFRGRDKPEKIRNFIKYAYKQHRVKYILLGGDADADSTSPSNIIYHAVVPTRLLYCGYVASVATYEYIASDLYYSCLGGTYDSDKDKRFGETTDGNNGTQVDLLPDVYVGRAPVTSVAQVNRFVSKTIAYESRSKLKKALMVGEYMGNYSGTYVYGKNYKEEIRKGSTLTFNSKRIPTTYSVSTLYDKDRSSNWTSTNIINRLNNNPELVNHMGHANNTYVMRLYPSSLSSLTNTKSFFVFSHGCYAGGFDNMKSSDTYTTTDSMAEQFITVSNRAGAVATIMNSRYGWFYSDSTDGGTQYFDRSFFHKYVLAPRTSVGVLLAKSKIRIFNLGIVTTQNVYRYCYYELNLMGDPEMSLTTKNALLGTRYSALDERQYVLDLTGTDTTANPQTGDSFPMIMLLIVLAISLCGLAFLLLHTKLRYRRAQR